MAHKEIVIIILRNSSGQYHVNQRRADKQYFPSYYALGAGGRVEEGETPEQAALRELTEELGIRVQPTYRFSAPFHSPIVSHLMHVFDITYDDALQPTDQEFQWTGWMTPDQVDQILAGGKMCPDLAVAYQRYRQKST